MKKKSFLTRKSTQTVGSSNLAPLASSDLSRQKDVRPPLKRLSAVRLDKIIPVPRKKVKRSKTVMPHTSISPHLDASTVEQVESEDNFNLCQDIHNTSCHSKQATTSSKLDTKRKNKELFNSIQALKTELSAKNDVIDKANIEAENCRAVITSMKEEFTCAICKELFINAFSLVCSHLFCELCIKEWLSEKKRQECPICRVRITAQPVCSVVLNNAISKLEAKLSEDEMQERTKTKQEHIVRLEKIPKANSIRCYQVYGGPFDEFSNSSFSDDMSYTDSSLSHFSSSDSDDGDSEDSLGTSLDSFTSSSSDESSGSDNDPLIRFSDDSSNTSGSQQHNDRSSSVQCNNATSESTGNSLGQDSDKYFTCSEGEQEPN